MPAPEVVDRYQTAVLWPFSGYDAYGAPTVGPPVELAPPYGVRWTWKRREVMDAKGNTVALDASVVTDRKVAPDSLMWLGTLAGWYRVGSAGRPDEVMLVVSHDETPDIKNRAVRREMGLKRYRETLP